jgi:transcription initiation factor TFIIIB Brf1 subunit/transcription initiation factor TFIIB
MSRSVRRRVRILELRVGGTYPADLVARLAEQYDLDEGEIIAEAERLITRFARAGATTWEAQLRIVAEDRGIPVEDLRAEIDQMKVDVR